MPSQANIMAAAAVASTCNSHRLDIWAVAAAEMEEINYTTIASAD